MANQYGSPPSIPWKFRPDFGNFVYRRSTDQIVPQNGRPYPRPSHIPAHLLSNAIWEPFQYTGSPPSSSSGFMTQRGQLPGIQLQPGQVRAQAGQSSQPRTFPNGPGQNRQPSVQDVTQAIRDCGLDPRVRTTEFQQNGQNLQHAFDPRTSVATLGATLGQASSQSSRGQPSNPRQGRAGKSDSRDVLYPDYKIHKSKFFVVGRVFLVLWTEPAGGGGTAVSRYEVLNHLGQRVFSKIRRFVVVRAGPHFCSALPISTYNGQGVAKQTVVKSDHAIIYTGPIAPTPRRGELPGRGEAPMRSIPIRVDLDNATEKLDPMSRINFGGVHLIQHNVKTKSFGVVNKNSLTRLRTVREGFAWGRLSMIHSSRVLIDCLSRVS